MAGIVRAGDCYICNDPLSHPQLTLSCGDVFHKSCIEQHLLTESKQGENDANCPLCKRVIVQKFKSELPEEILSLTHFLEKEHLLMRDALRINIFASSQGIFDERNERISGLQNRASATSPTYFPEFQVLAQRHSSCAPAAAARPAAADDKLKELEELYDNVSNEPELGIKAPDAEKALLLELLNNILKLHSKGVSHNDVKYDNAVIGPQTEDHLAEILSRPIALTPVYPGNIPPVQTNIKQILREIDHAFGDAQGSSVVPEAPGPFDQAYQDIYGHGDYVPQHEFTHLDRPFEPADKNHLEIHPYPIQYMEKVFEKLLGKLKEPEIDPSQRLIVVEAPGESPALERLRNQVALIKSALTTSNGAARVVQVSSSNSVEKVTKVALSNLRR